MKAVWVNVRNTSSTSTTVASDEVQSVLSLFEFRVWGLARSAGHVFN